MPGNVTYSSNVTVLQRYVEGNDYGSPQFFQYNNGTDFSIKGKFFSHDEYVIICKAPLYSTPELLSTPMSTHYNRLGKVESLASNVGSESLHLTSCKKPYHRMDITFSSLLGVGLALFLFSLASCSFMCFCMFKYHRDRLFLSCKFCRSRNGYFNIQ